MDATSRFNFEDVNPVDISQDPNQLCQILYDDEYKGTMGILLGLMRNKEYSDRALYMTERGIDLLASHYTIWNYRYDILVALKKDLFEELDWCEEIALNNEKNYQIWNYRQLIIEEILKDGQLSEKFNPHREYPILDAMLEADVKNHHVWSYRKWLIQRFQLYKDEKEIDFVNKCIESDLRNNSAWTHRFFLKFSQAESITSELVEAEIEFTKQLIEVSPQNPSSWNYLTGIYRLMKREFDDLESFCLTYANIFEEKSDVFIKSSFALEILAQIYGKKDIVKSNRIYDALSETYDPIRTNYWKYKKSQLKAV